MSRYLYGSSSTLNRTTCESTARQSFFQLHRRLLYSRFYFAMADSASNKAKVMPQAPPRDRVRSTFQLEVEADQKWRLDRVKSHIQRVKDSLHITSRTPMGNVLVMERLLCSFEESEQRRMASASYSSMFPSSSFHHHDYKPSPLTCNAETQTVCNPSVLPFVLSIGENTTGRFDIHTASRPDEDYFVASTAAINQLMGTMAKYNGRCPLCGYDLDMQSFEVLRHGHTVRISIFCAAGHSLRWFSSSSISGKFTANLRYVISHLYSTRYTII